MTSIKKIRKYFAKKDLFIPFLLIIIIFGATLRIFDFYNNWSMGIDDARDVMIASQALKRLELPLIGPFSSAGAFVTGPVYFWIVMVSLLVFPFGTAGPWIMLIVLSVLNIAVFACIGYLLRGKRLALMLALLSATSLQLIKLGTNLTNPTFILLFCSLLILSFILFVKKKKLRYIFFAGISLGIALNMHYQAINLLVFLPFIFLIKGIDLKKRIYSALLFISGIIIMLLPLLWWDHYQNFSNINNILDYLLIGQYRIYVPNSWKIFLFTDLPLIWGYILGGSKYFGFLSMGIVSIGGIFLLAKFKKLKKDQLLYFLPAMLFIMLFVNRYYHGQRLEVYLLYLTPFIIVVFGLFFDLFLDPKLFARRKIVDFLIYCIFVIFIFGNLFVLYGYLNKNKGNLSVFKTSIQDLKTKYPGKKFSLHDRNQRSLAISLPFSLMMAREGLQDANGIKISIDCIPSKTCPTSLEPIIKIGDFPVGEISTFSARQIKKEFSSVNEENIYDSLIGWSKKHELKHTFNLKDYLKERLRLHL